MRKFEVKEICQSCNGTGLYIGMGEGDGAAIVCHTCDGTGCHKFIHKYKEFVKKQITRKVIRVFKVNPGFGVCGQGLENFGGMPYRDWYKGEPFPEKSEMRKLTCPAWWYQSADYKKKPKWDECTCAGTFSSCPYYKSKKNCWEKWDKEFSINKEEK